MKKIYKIVFSLVLCLFTGYALLDTFVISRPYSPAASATAADAASAAVKEAVDDSNNMSTSKLKKVRRNYCITTVLCIIFSAIYEHFSFGVYSNAMIFAFLFPLIGGVAVFTLLLLFKGKIKIPDSAVLLYNSAVALFTVGSLFTGIVEIYGTTNRLSYVYVIAGIAFLCASIISGIAVNIWSGHEV